MSDIWFSARILYIFCMWLCSMPFCSCRVQESFMRKYKWTIWKSESDKDARLFRILRKCSTFLRFSYRTDTFWVKIQTQPSPTVNQIAFSRSLSVSLSHFRTSKCCDIFEAENCFVNPYRHSLVLFDISHTQLMSFIWPRTIQMFLLLAHMFIGKELNQHSHSKTLSICRRRIGYM